MKKEEIVKVVIDYVNNDKEKYAVLISGAWGSGKTYLYENVLKGEIDNVEYGSNDRKTNVYISLYGISSVEQLSKELVTNYLFKVKLREDEDKQKVYGKLSKAMGIISKMISFSVNGLSFNLGDGINEIKTIIEFKDMVICLDDFERCSIPVNELFGMINNLVEHCNCKVIILADEDNIGKMYANTNVEAKYMTLLMGKTLKDKTYDENVKNKDKTKSINELTVNELKRLNEEIYSENYIYKDIKEKVIGLSLKYTPALKEDFDSIIKSVVNNQTLQNMLIERKDKILEYMNNCENNNIRIMKSWLLNFEKIFNVINKNFSDNKYFDEIFKRFTIYSIRVACAIGKNKKLEKWEKGTEVGYRNLDDLFMVERQGYRFIDDLYNDSLYDEIRICQAARVILNEKIREEDLQKKSNQGNTLKKLNQWYYIEDEEIKLSLPNLKTELENDEYTPQEYQSIISLLVLLYNYEYFKEDLLSEIIEIIKGKVLNSCEKMDVDNYQYYFEDDEELNNLYHKYYDPIYSLINKKNVEIEKQQIYENINYSKGIDFFDYCVKNYDKFISKGSFISYINLDVLEETIKKGKIGDIYYIGQAFNKIYYFSNLDEYYSDDADELKIFVNKLKNLDIKGNTRKIAIEKLIYTLNSKIKAIEKK